MSKEKQILQYCGDGRSQRQTAASLGVSRNTVSSVIAAATREGITPQAAASMDEPDLIRKLFPEKAYRFWEDIHRQCADNECLSARVQGQILPRQ